MNLTICSSDPRPLVSCCRRLFAAKAHWAICLSLTTLAGGGMSLPHIAKFIQNRRK